MDASLKLLHSVLPASVGLRAAISATHPSAQILGTERMGSGILVDEAGILLTVNYVVLGAETVEVTLLDQTVLSGAVVARDFASGLAAVKIPGSRYPMVPGHSSQQLHTGQEVFVVASAGGSRRRVNTGAVFSLQPFDAFWEYRLERSIMTTAMNPGLGGGGLFTMDGALAGVVSIDCNEVGRSSLAIPADHFFEHRDELLHHGRRVTRPARAWIGLYCYVLRNHVIVGGVLPGAPADRAGLKPGDVIVSVDGTEVSERTDFYARLWMHKPGEVIRLRVFRDIAAREFSVEGASAEEFFA